jgi:hypothetical protein
MSAEKQRQIYKNKKRQRRATMKMHLLRQFSILLVCALLGWIGRAEADAVMDWNVITGQAIATATAAGRPGQVAGLDFAMVHAAIHDAVQAYDGQFEPYCTDISNADGSPVAAIAKAAHDVLVNRFPDQAGTLDTTYSNYLANNGLSESDLGVAVGQLAAACLIALRANDGSFPDPPPPPFLGGTDPGEWRPTPPAFAPGLIPWLGAVTPFALQSIEQCHPEPPPNLSSKVYRKDYNEVKKLGSVTSADRTADQTDMAHFWSANIFQTWSLGLRDITSAHIDNIGDSARLFALNYISNADAAICAWESKYFFVFWRPVTAIQEGDFDGNSDTDGDTTWLPLLTTPPYPAYTSGANNISGSTTRTLARFFDTETMSFSLTSTFPPTIEKTRTYSEFSEPADEVFEARILQGIHFRFDDKIGREQGQKVADYAFENFFQPIDDDD